MTQSVSAHFVAKRLSFFNHANHVWIEMVSLFSVTISHELHRIDGPSFGIIDVVDRRVIVVAYEPHDRPAKVMWLVCNNDHAVRCGFKLFIRH